MFNSDNLNQIQNIGLPTFTFREGGRTTGISRIFPVILPYIFAAAGIILVFNLISAGFRLMTSSGDPKATGAAQAKITTSLIGILVIFVSFWVVKLILQFFGINIQLI